MFVKKINSAVHVTDLYNLYITLSCSDVNIFFVISFILSNFVHCFCAFLLFHCCSPPFSQILLMLFFSFLYVFPLTNSQINLAASFASSFYRLNNCSHTWFYYLCNICSIISHTFYILRNLFMSSDNPHSYTRLQPDLFRISHQIPIHPVCQTNLLPHTYNTPDQIYSMPVHNQSTLLPVPS